MAKDDVSPVAKAEGTDTDTITMTYVVVEKNQGEGADKLVDVDDAAKVYGEEKTDTEPDKVKWVNSSAVKQAMHLTCVKRDEKAQNIMGRRLLEHMESKQAMLLMQMSPPKQDSLIW